MKITNLNHPQFAFLVLNSIDEVENKMIDKRQICKAIDSILFEYTVKLKQTFLLRGTKFDNLLKVVNFGVDVIPTDSPIFLSDDPCKAIEYGWDLENEKMIILAYKSIGIQRSWVEVSSDLAEQELKNILRTYPTIEYSIDRSKIFLSKLSLDDSRRNTAYEIAYGYWIPNNPMEQIFSVFLIGKFTESEILRLKDEVKK
jgi:hypothetical protein